MSTAVQTRQKNDVLFSSETPIGAGASIGFGPKEIDGFAETSILVLSDQPFSINLFEASFPDGPYQLSQSYTSVSSGNPAAGNMVAQRFFVTGSFLKMTLDNTSGAPETVLSLLVQGIPLP